MIQVRVSPFVAAATAATIALGIVGCSLGQARRVTVGGASTSNEQDLDQNEPAPNEVYVGDFVVEVGAIKPASGLVAGATETVGEVLQQRPRLLGGGILGKRLGSDTPQAGDVIDTLAASITDGLNKQGLGILAMRMPPGAPLPSSGWVINGRFVSVDPGNRAERAVVGFGTGEATTEVLVEVDRLGLGTSTPVLRFGTQADSGKMPGAAVTLNPYVAAAKFVLGKQATTRDVQAMGGEIAKQIGEYARSRRAGPN